LEFAQRSYVPQPFPKLSLPYSRPSARRADFSMKKPRCNWGRKRGRDSFREYLTPETSRVPEYVGFAKELSPSDGQLRDRFIENTDQAGNWDITS